MARSFAKLRVLALLILWLIRGDPLRHRRKSDLPTHRRRYGRHSISLAGSS